MPAKSRRERRKCRAALPSDEAQTEWLTWSEGIRRQIEGPLRDRLRLAQLSVLEQRMLRSKAEQRCIECGLPGVERLEGGGLVQSVDHYWFCAECDKYWRRRAESEQRPVGRAVG